MLETVHIVLDFFDCPRSGVADYQGNPHYFSCDWDEATGDYGHSFSLFPINDQFMEIALAQLEISQQGVLAFSSGIYSANTNVGHRDIDQHYNQLQQLIDAFIKVLPASQIHLNGNFQRLQNDTELLQGVKRPFRVLWSSAV